MRVFISGVSRIFASHREAAAGQLRKHGIDPVQQKEFPPTFEKITDMLRKEVRSCDAVICLVGPAYGFAPHGQAVQPPRSYTQIEYDVARELQKPVYVFKPAEACPLDAPPQDSDERLAWQKAFQASLEQADHLVREYRNIEGLQVLVTEIIKAVADIAVQAAIRMHYPTPLALLYGECFHGKDAKPDERNCSNLLSGTLRLLGLLAAQDAVASETFGAGCADADAIVSQCVLGDIGEDTWHGLLRLACAAGPALGARRLVEEFQGWEEKHRGTLGELVGKFCLLKKAKRRADHDNAMGALQSFLPSLFKAVDFLTRYALVGIAADSSGAAASCRGWIFRGEHPAEVTLSADVPLRANDLYLLSLDRRQALLLDPGLRFHAEKSKTELWGLSSLEIEPDDGRVTYENFVERDSFTSEALSARELFARWLGPAAAARPGRVFDEGSWQLIQKRCLPDELGELMFVGGHKLARTPFHRGRYADLYETLDELQPESGPGEDGPRPGRALVHRLREESAGDPDVRAWFDCRAAAWRAIRHPSVVPLLPQSGQTSSGEPATSGAGDASGGPLYLAAQFIPDATTLAGKLETSAALPESLCCSILEVAAEVCLEAHRQGIYVMALPPHHFLIDGQERVHLTGFEAALSEANPLWRQMTAPDYFSKFTRQRNSIDPAVLSGRMKPGPLADIYALGTLLAALRGQQAQAAEWLPMSAWNDPWKCLAFHALAARPNLRFQGPEHLLRGVREWLKRAAGDAPETLHVPAGRLGAAPVAEFWIGKYPVTNAQYAFFCMARGLRPPYYLETEDARGQDRLALAGPWCPVTHVCLDHAQQYCEWLGQRTGRRWRLPREREWVRAALLEGAGPYPWGTAEPSSRHANYDRFLTSPTVVGAFPEGRSAAGCYDMAGNVWEWCSDFVSDHESLRVLKGGAYDFSSDCLKVARRQGVVALYRSAHAGFRVVCEEKPDG